MLVGHVVAEQALEDLAAACRVHVADDVGRDLHEVPDLEAGGGDVPEHVLQRDVELVDRVGGDGAVELLAHLTGHEQHPALAAHLDLMDVATDGRMDGLGVARLLHAGSVDGAWR